MSELLTCEKHGYSWPNHPGAIACEECRFEKLEAERDALRAQVESSAEDRLRLVLENKQLRAALDAAIDYLKHIKKHDNYSGPGQDAADALELIENRLK